MVSRTPDKSWYAWDEEGGHCEWEGWWANLLGCDLEKTQIGQWLAGFLAEISLAVAGRMATCVRHIFAELTRVALSVADVTVCTDLRVALKARSKGEFIIR